MGHAGGPFRTQGLAVARDTDDDFLDVDDAPAPTGGETRSMLRNVGAYRGVVGAIRGSSWSALLFGAFFIGIWYFAIPANQKYNPFGLLYLGLGVLEFTVGLLNLLRPSLEGILFDGLVLIVFGVQSAARQFLLVVAATPMLLFSAYMLYSGVQRCRNYFQIRRAFPVRPTAANLRWFNDLIRDVRKADPANDPTALDLPSKPPLRAKLLGDTAFLVASGTDDLIILAADELALIPTASEGEIGRVTKAFLMLDGVSREPFPIDGDNWGNYTDWRKANGLE